MYSASSVDPTISILLLKTAEDTNAALQPLLDANPPFVAFDLEYGHPAKKLDNEQPCQPEVDLIQIAFGSQVFLIHLAAFGMSHTTLPIVLRKILESPMIRKVANNIRGDAARLFASHAINLLNCADLSYVARHVDPARWPLKVSTTQRLRIPRYWFRAPNYIPDNTRSLDRLTFVYTRRILSKDATLENWHDGTLTRRMQEYAADDAHATLTVCTVLAAMPSFGDIVFHRYAFDMFEGRPYHAGVSPRKAWRADNEVV